MGAFQSAMVRFWRAIERQDIKTPEELCALMERYKLREEMEVIIVGGETGRMMGSTGD